MYWKVLWLLSLLGMASSLEQDIVLRFGENSLRIEKDGEKTGDIPGREKEGR